MQPAITSDLLKKMAVEAVGSYLGGTDLEDAVASVAAKANLSQEQIKRLVEASNQLCYLKLMESASDRTFEFPVAEFNNVVGKMVRPDQAGQEKQASTETIIHDPFLEQFASMEKAAGKGQVQAPDLLEGLTASAVHSLIIKQAGHAEMELEKIAQVQFITGHKLAQACESLKADTKVLEKLAHVCDTREGRTLYSALGGDMEKIAETCKLTRFTEVDLVPVHAATELLKQAFDLEQAKAHFSDTIGKARTALKEAIPKKIDPTKNLVKSFGGAVSKAVKVGLSTPVTHMSIGATFNHKRNVWSTLQGGTKY